MDMNQNQQDNRNGSENNEYNQNQNPNQNQNQNSNQNNTNSYGAIYTPNGNNGDNSYRYTPYVGQGVYNYQPAQAAPTQKKQKSHIGLVIAITCCVLVVIIAALAGVVVAKTIIGQIDGYENTEVTDAVEESTKSNSGKNQGTVIIADDTDSSGVVTKTVVSGEEMSRVDVVKAVKDSVVEITTETVTSGRGVLSQYITSGAGSGVIISDSGLVITNNHVIEDASRITVRLTNGNEYDATLIGTDEENDIAVISFDPGTEVLTSAIIGDSSKLEVGQDIIVIGNPLGQLGGTVTAGIISATERDIEVDEVGTMTLIQTDAAVNSGNSGGGMFNMKGELVGIVNSKYSGSSIEGLAFAIPINNAWKVADELMEYGYVRGKATLGISVIDVTNVSYAWYYFGSRTAGVFIAEDNDTIGVQKGDRIVSINDVEISSSTDISTFLRTASVGDKVTITVVRNNRTVTITATLSEKTPTNSN